jgi:hypothetical protein
LICEAHASGTAADDQIVGRQHCYPPGTYPPDTVLAAIGSRFSQYRPRRDHERQLRKLCRNRLGMEMGARKNREHLGLDVGSGSKADLTASKSDFRFTLMSGLK